MTYLSDKNVIMDDQTRRHIDEQRLNVTKELTSRQFTSDTNYSPLRSVLDEAYRQASEGKGRERHANGKPFDRQPILEISRMVGLGYPTGQAQKKAQEAVGMFNRGKKDAAVAELLGAINYLAAAVILIKEN